MRVIDLLKVIHQDEEIWFYDYNNHKWSFYTSGAKVEACHDDKTVLFIGTNGEGTLEIYIK